MPLLLIPIIGSILGFTFIGNTVADNLTEKKVEVIGGGAGSKIPLEIKIPLVVGTSVFAFFFIKNIVKKL